jgi:signal transduction histidine kinase
VRILGAFPCAAFLLDAKGRVVHSNRIARRHMVAGATDPRGLHYAEVFPPAIVQEVGVVLKELGTEGEVREPVDDRMVQLPGGQAGVIRGVSVSERRWRPCASLLTIEDASASVELRRALDWAALAQQLAHEIKNPLHTVLLTLQRLQLAYHETRTKSSAAMDRYVDSAIEEIERLRAIADGFLRFTSLKPPKVCVMEARELLSAVERQVRQWLPETVNLIVECEEGLPQVRVDLEATQRLFYNIFDNAVRAMRGKGRIFLRVGMAQWLTVGEPVRREFVAFEVSDTGCGIPEELLGRVFEPYVAGKDGGTGLGLSICRQIVKEHGGRISLQSKVGAGTTVRVELPAYQA